ncbi:MAG: glutamate synthase-related protein [Syntrophobacterales bacterium]
MGELAAAGAEILHLAANVQGRGFGEAGDLHVKDLIRQTHLKLVELRLRDSVTLLASGGIAMAEHVAKAIVCGADGVIVDLPLLIALECRICRQREVRRLRGEVGRAMFVEDLQKEIFAPLFARTVEESERREGE